MELSPLNVQLATGSVWLITLFFGCAIIIADYFTRFLPAFIPTSARILWVYVLVYSLFIIEYPSPHFGPFTIAYQATTAQTFAEAVFIPIGAITLFSFIGKYRVIPILAAVSVVCAWTKWGGLLGAYTFNSAFAAACIPFCPGLLVACIVVTALFHHGSTALMVIGAQMLALAVIGNRTAKIIFASIVTPVLLAAAFIHSGSAFDSGTRIAKYKSLMSFWLTQHKFIAIGTGPGTFVWTSVMLSNFKGQLFLQMHSDWLQIAFELGLIGFALVGWVYVKAARNVWREPRLLSAIFGVGALGLTYYPLRFFPSALLTAYIFVSCFSYKNSSTEDFRSSYFPRPQ